MWEDCQVRTAPPGPTRSVTGTAAVAETTVALSLALTLADRDERETRRPLPRAALAERAALAQGSAGLALAFGQFDRCFPDEGWDAVAHGFLRTAVQHAERAHAL